MKNLILILLLIPLTAISQVNLCGTIGINLNNGNIGLGMLEKVFNKRISLVQEFISTVPHTTNSTYFGGRVGIKTIENVYIEGGYYYDKYSSDKTEYTKGKNTTRVAGFLCYDKKLYRVQLGYLKQLQLLFTIKLPN